jgi:hypothetical protein
MVSSVSDKYTLYTYAMFVNRNPDYFRVILFRITPLHHGISVPSVRNDDPQPIAFTLEPLSAAHALQHATPTMLVHQLDVI